MKLSPKQKFIALVGGSFILMILSYQLSIKKTVELRAQLGELEAQSQFSRDLPTKLASLKQDELYYKKILNDMNLGGSSIQNNLIKFLNDQIASGPVRLLEVNKPHLVQMENHLSTTYQIKLRGSYNDLLKIIHALEQEGNFGEVIHLNFEKKKNYKTGRYRLEAQVFLRQIQ